MFDYDPIKNIWANWVKFFLNSNLHIISCGRASGLYEARENFEGKDEMLMVDEKFKAEKEFGFEASLLIQMRPIKSTKGLDIHAFVWKDKFGKFTNLTGKEFINPEFKDIKPYFDHLNLGGQHIGIEKGSDTVEMLKTPRPGNDEYDKHKKIALEEIQGLLMDRFPSTSGEHKKGKMAAIKAVFNTTSWTAVESMSLDGLQEAVRLMDIYLKKMPSEVSK